MRKRLLECDMPAYHFRADRLVRICTKCEGRLKTSRPSIPFQYRLKTQIGKYLWLGFFHGQQVVAIRAILRNCLSGLRHMVAIVAAEAARIAHVTDIVRMCSP